LTVVDSVTVWQCDSVTVAVAVAVVAVTVAVKWIVMGAGCKRVVSVKTVGSKSL
jgi:hypothetical protein